MEAPDSPFTPDGQILERDQRLSDSMLWRAQRRYFDREGVRSWSTATVPHYVTANPAFAHSIAQVVFGFLRDQASSRATGEPFYIIELGAGSGRFGYLFLRALLDLLAQSTLKDVPIRYVMTDFTESNLAFWRAHPALRPFVSEGVLDFALYDAEQTRELVCRESGTTLRPGGLERPLIVLANYVFDGIPQDAFSFREGRLEEELLTLAGDAADPELSGLDPFSSLQLSYRGRPVGFDYYPEPEFNELLRAYAGALSGSTILFPVAGLRCVQRLAELSKHGLLMVSGDKGQVDLEELVGGGTPALTVHGSFSVSVNYHAFCEWFRKKGGEALRADHAQLGLQVLALLLGPATERAVETRLAYRQAFDGASSDDFFRFRQGVQAHYGVLQFEHLLSFIRLSRYDPRILRDCLPVLVGEVAGLSSPQRRELVRAVSRVWKNYFHIGETHDVAFDFATLLHLLGEQDAAIELFRASLELYGEDPRTHWNVAMCWFALGRPEDAARSLARAWEIHPGFMPEVGLMKKEG